MMSGAVFPWLLDRHIGSVSENNPPSLTQQQIVCTALELLFCCLSGLRSKITMDHVGGEKE